MNWGRHVWVWLIGFKKNCLSDETIGANAQDLAEVIELLNVSFDAYLSPVRQLEWGFLFIEEILDVSSKLLFSLWYLGVHLRIYFLNWFEIDQSWIWDFSVNWSRFMGMQKNSNWLKIFSKGMLGDYLFKMKFVVFILG